MLNKIGSIFQKIARFFDKHVVIPTTRIVLKITNGFDKSSHKLEGFLAKTSTLLILSLLLAIILSIAVNNKILTLTTSSAKVFKDQKAEVLYNEERFVITGIPDSFDITLIGSKADLYIAEQSSNHNVKLDLTNIKEAGTYKVDVEYDSNGLSTIEYSVNPSQVTIVVYDKESKNQTLSYNVINQDHLEDTLEVSNVELNLGQVVISGADFQLDKVATVQALIDIDNLPKLEEGTQTLENLPLRAYDKEGNVVEVEINKKENVSAKVTLTSSSREVNLNFVPINEVPFGNAISSYSFSQETVTVYGSTAVLDQLEQNGIDIKVDVSKLTSNYEADVEIERPVGVKKLSANKVTVKIEVTQSANPVAKTIKVDALNIPAGFAALAASEDDSEVMVDITGAYNVIHNLKDTELQVYVDLSGYKEEGTYDVPVKIRPTSSNARLATFVPKKATVKILLKKKS